MSRPLQPGIGRLRSGNRRDADIVMHGERSPMQRP